MRYLPIVLFLFLLASCRGTHIKEHNEWAALFSRYGIKDGCFILRDHAHETVNIYNKERCLQRFTPASTFKIFNSLVALETGIAKDDGLVIPWDSVQRGRPEWNHSMDMREAFRVSNPGYYQELARRAGRQNLQHYLDTVKYGNMKIGNAVDSFWLDGSLQISADEQAGFVRKLYFDELPFIVRTQSIVRSMMLREDTTDNRLYYKTGWGSTAKGAELLWVVGFMEHVSHVKEDPASMNKSGVRNYPYFFALNFEVPQGDKSQDWFNVRIKLLHSLLDNYGATREE